MTMKFGHILWVSVLAAMVLALQPAWAADSGERVTFTKDVLPILQDNCQMCHRPNGANLGGMVAPMSFVSYEETRPWAKAIARQVGTKEMPPWNAAPQHHGVFKNERILSVEDAAVLVRWVATGAARGKPADAPPALDWPNDGWTIGEPDMVIEMPESFWVADEVEDTYEYFRMTVDESLLPEDRWIQATEFRPGSPVVHHIIARPIGGIAPGNDPTVYPEGLGVMLKTGTEITWAMHYHKEPGPGTGVFDRSSVAVKFYPKGTEIEHRLTTEPLGTYDFVIPAGASRHVVTRDFIFKQDAQIVALMPHMHLRGAAAKYEITYPDGKHEVLLDIPIYDFNWQTTYEFKEFKAAPAGTKLTLTTVFDNSADNPYNPDPTVDVRFGEPTTAEMSFGWMRYYNENDDSRTEGTD